MEAPLALGAFGASCVVWFAFSIFYLKYRDGRIRRIGEKYGLQLKRHTYPTFSYLYPERPQIIRELTGLICGRSVQIQDVIRTKWNMSPQLRGFPPWWWLYDPPWWRSYETRVVVDGVDLRDVRANAGFASERALDAILYQLKKS